MIPIVIEDNYDIPFVSELSRREKQIQQNYRPIIAVHKWFARRPGTLFRSLLLSEFSDIPLHKAFYQTGNLSGKTIADPFMGGGTPLIEANRMGANIKGCDINPMAYWIVRQELEYLDTAAYQGAADIVRESLEKEIGSLYRTRCEICGNEEAHAKYFLYVKTQTCNYCGTRIDLFPGYLISENVRHPKNVIVCKHCGALTETMDRNNPGHCSHCGLPLIIEGPAHGNHCECPRCHKISKYPDIQSGIPQGPLSHRLFAIEYYCPECKDEHQGRFFKAPDSADFEKLKEAEKRLESIHSKYIPQDAIPSGDETNRLHRWGYTKYRELFNPRQLLSLELSCRLISKQTDERIHNALATNLSDLLRYQNMLCRYDTTVLKSLDIFSVHGFPVGLIQCESNFLGIKNGGGIPQGSGGWLNIIEKYIKAKKYCTEIFEVQKDKFHKGNKKIIVPIPGEWIGDNKDNSSKRILDISCQDAASVDWKPNGLDGVFTDPPYFGNVQYAELMDFCYVWLRNLVKLNTTAFAPVSTRNENELTGNNDMQRGLGHFTQGLSKIFTASANALKAHAPFVFTYHHNDITAYYPVAVAILDASLYCSKVLPCPTEMSASIHIKGTVSSIIDSIFVCRHKKYMALGIHEDLNKLVEDDISALVQGDYTPTNGDIRCIVHGHIIRKCVNTLSKGWDAAQPVEIKLSVLSNWFSTPKVKDSLNELINLTVPKKKKEYNHEFVFV